MVIKYLRLTSIITLLMLLFVSGCSDTAIGIVDGESFKDVTIKTNITAPLEDNGGIPVNIQDQTTRPFDIRVNQIINISYTLAESPTVNSYTLNLTSVLGLTVGDNIAFLEQNGMPQLLSGEILSITGTLIEIDTPVPYAYIPSNTTVFSFDSSLAVDGSTNTQIFSITNFFTDTVDITRFIFTCRDTTSIDDSLFCGESELDRGIVLRKKKIDGNYINYWNIKNNGQWGDLAYDSAVNDRAPAGEYGFKSRLTYGGQSKHGVVIRLEPNESIELLVQDDLTGLTYGSLMVEGHFVQD